MHHQDSEYKTYSRTRGLITELNAELMQQATTPDSTDAASEL